MRKADKKGISIGDNLSNYWGKENRAIKACAITGGIIGLCCSVLVIYEAINNGENITQAVLIGLIAPFAGAGVFPFLFGWAWFFLMIPFGWILEVFCEHGHWMGHKDKNGKCRCEYCEQKYVIAHQEQIKRAEQLQQEQMLVVAAQKHQQAFRTAFTDAKKMMKHILKIDEASIRALGDLQFEDDIAELFRRMGYAVEQTPYSGDGGKDIILHDNRGRTIYVECKHYGESHKVGINEVLKLSGAMSGDNVAKGIFVTTSSFTQQAIAEAEKNNNHIDLIDMRKLLRLYEKYANQDDLMFELYKIPCRYCGVEVSFAYGDTINKRCKSGHFVKNIYSMKSAKEAISCPKCGGELTQSNDKNNYLCATDGCDYMMPLSVYNEYREKHPVVKDLTPSRRRKTYYRKKW